MIISKKLKENGSGSLALLILFLSTLLFFIPILVLGLLKLIPNQTLKINCTKRVDKIAQKWVGINALYIEKSQLIEWKITGLENFKTENWYLVVANHQSWLDIVVLQSILNRKIPVLKFFIKDQLKWVPFLGFSWWAMGCPFMKRYTPAYLAKHPHKKGKDLKATQKALQLFKQTPATLMSFIEGTRYTTEKSLQQQSPYQHLLKPKAGGIGLVISAMNQQINQLLDVTISYPNGDHSLWNFLCNRMQTIHVHIRQLPIPKEFLSPSLIEDDKTQSEFRQWLNEKWAEKDELITLMKNEHDNTLAKDET